MPRVRRQLILAPKALRIKRDLKVLRRFLAKVEEAGTHWFWKGHTDENGYGQFKYKGRAIGAHRASYAIFKQALPDNMEVDHSCRVVGCVNPNHLRKSHPLVNAGRNGKHEEPPF